MDHKVYDQLLKKNIISSNSLELFHVGTRDNPNISAFKCSITGLIMLDDICTDLSYYEENLDYATDHLNLTTEESTAFSVNDDFRRYMQYQKLFKDKAVLDFGCGQGNFAKYLKGYDIDTVELNKINRDKLNNIGITCYSDLNESKKKYDIIILNHVFEHLVDLDYFLDLFKEYLRPKGLLIIEVPSADDFLIKTLSLMPFISFTLWSEHIVLWTKETLNNFVEKANFKNINSEWFQRYPYSNHFGWIKDGKPGGHKIYSALNKDNLNNNYRNMLLNLGQADTIISTFQKL